jgi:hypothetical protein
LYDVSTRPLCFEVFGVFDVLDALAVDVAVAAVGLALVVEQLATATIARTHRPNHLPRPFPTGEIVRCARERGLPFR